VARIHRQVAFAVVPDIVPDNDATRGMVRQVRFLVSVEEVAEESPRGRGRAASDAGQSDAEAVQEQP